MKGKRAVVGVGLTWFVAFIIIVFVILLFGILVIFLAGQRALNSPLSDSGVDFVTKNNFEYDIQRSLILFLDRKVMFNGQEMKMREVIGTRNDASKSVFVSEAQKFTSDVVGAGAGGALIRVVDPTEDAHKESKVYSGYEVMNGISRCDEGFIFKELYFQNFKVALCTK